MAEWARFDDIIVALKRNQKLPRHARVKAKNLSNVSNSSWP